MDYSLLDFYRQSPDWIKGAVIIGIPAFTLGLLWLLLWYRVEIIRIERVWPRMPAPAPPTVPSAAPAAPEGDGEPEKA